MLGSVTWLTVEETFCTAPGSGLSSTQLPPLWGVPLWTRVPPVVLTWWLYLNSVGLPSSIWVPPPRTHLNRQGWQKTTSWCYLNCLPSLGWQQDPLWAPQLSVSSRALAGSSRDHLMCLMSSKHCCPLSPDIQLLLHVFCSFDWGLEFTAAGMRVSPWNALWKLKLTLHCNSIKSWRVLEAG